ncbi:DUF6266 family protein [Pedobacter sp. MC2016-14]|uniref:DUF6266 family protein n=1 Tax=Pedobacter sp. MC2016-14 TaxID=2897327 RepID=UPI001E657E1F|nr:DUF6266 family protein [Pedobacter sp. MC2016-14]MCD0487485.1 DUF6266 family protein [Pedobacter sp. MC2016-14]
MGKITEGINGPHTGKAGNVISYMLRGQNVTRVIGRNYKPFTEEQNNNLLQMSVVNELYAAVSSFINVGFGPISEGTPCYPQNLFIKYNKPDALTGYIPDVTVNFAKLLLSYGKLPKPENAKVEMVKEGLRFSWDAKNEASWPRHRDQVMMMAYFPEEKKAVFETSGAKKSKGFDILPLKEYHMARVMELYIAFNADDRKDVSTSLYLGRIEPANGLELIVPAELEKKAADVSEQAVRGIARNLKTMGLSADNIAKATGLTVTIIETL